jgi:hypothetical protein
MNKPEDYYIEQFWIDLKKSMNNFYNEIKNTIYRPINYWSDTLNELQKDKKYSLIESTIRDYMSLYAIDLLRTFSLYHTGILITNIKRWNTIAINNKFEIQTYTNNNEKHYINIVFLLLDLFNNLTNKCTTDNDELKIIFSMVELFIIHKDLTSLVDYAIKNNKPSIIDNINLFESQLNQTRTIKYIEDKYNIQLSPKISAKKFINKLTKIEN